MQEGNKLSALNLSIVIASVATVATMPVMVNAVPNVVSVKTAPVFGQATVIGKVFYDANANGILDAGEQGLAGVRLATVTGQLLETDGYGRFHIADNTNSHVNFVQKQLVKVDLASLPLGARMTTENPRLIKLTRSTLNKINFGVVF